MGQTKRNVLLFLGTGKSNRSRVAEVLFNDVAGKFGLPWQGSSKGLDLQEKGSNDGPMSAVAIKTLGDLGILLKGNMARHPEPVALADFEQADRIVALNKAEHLPLLEARFPDWSRNVEFWSVEDTPEALVQIESEVMSLVSSILGVSKREPPTETNSSSELPSKKDEPKKKPLTARVGRETKGRRGKGVTTVFDLPLNGDELSDLAGTLKQKCGTGGTVKDGRIEIQGDQRERIVKELEKMGFKVKRVGG